MRPRIVWAIVRIDFLNIWLNKSTLGGLVSPLILSLSLGLLFGPLFNSVQSASTVSGLVSLVYITRSFPGHQEALGNDQFY
jgi:prepilin signal peptidase PulO-like enzyme (type II secretory pathway)